MEAVKRLALLLPLLLAACAPASEDPPGLEPVPGCRWATVDRVVDGDTIIVFTGGERERVRYIGIDTAEMNFDGGEPEPFAEEAARHNEDLLDDGFVCLERDMTDRDRYGRLLRYAWLEDGTFVNEELLREGLAVIVTYPPDVKYVNDRYEPAQDEAQRAGRSIWGQ